MHSARTARTKRTTVARSGKMPTTSVRRRTSRLRRSWGLLDRFLHAGYGENGRMVELRVIKTVQEMDAARTRGGQADVKPAGGLGIAGRHERRRFIVVDENKSDLVLVAAKSLHDPVDAVAGEAEDSINIPFGEPLDQ
jgi:hypothetical protein